MLERFQNAVMEYAAMDRVGGTDPDGSADPEEAGASLPLEEWESAFEAARQHAAAGPGRQEITEVFESDPVQRMKKAAVTVAQWKQDYRTML